MSNLQMIAELCEICEMQNRVIREQATMLSQLGAVVMEEEREAAHRRYIDLLGDEEMSDEV